MARCSTVLINVPIEGLINKLYFKRILFTNRTILDDGSGWLVTASNDGQTYTDGLLYFPYDELCYDCTVSDDVGDMTAKTGDVMLAPVVCTRKV